MKRVYFAHSIKQYGSPLERDCLKVIKKEFPNYSIFNPSTIKYSDKDMREFFRVIRRSDIFVFTSLQSYYYPYHELFLIGVASELVYAIKKKIPIYYLCPKTFRFYKLSS